MGRVLIARKCPLFGQLMQIKLPIKKLLDYNVLNDFIVCSYKRGAVGSSRGAGNVETCTLFHNCILAPLSHGAVKTCGQAPKSPLFGHF